MTKSFLLTSKCDVKGLRWVVMSWASFNRDFDQSFRFRFCMEKLTHWSIYYRWEMRLCGYFGGEQQPIFTSMYSLVLGVPIDHMLLDVILIFHPSVVFVQPFHSKIFVKSRRDKCSFIAATTFLYIDLNAG